MNPESLHPTFTAGDVKNASGMSYRQINIWDAKGTLPNQREQGTSWRKFSAREIFTIMVCKEIRDRFGTSLESVRFVRDFMLQESADHLRAAIDIMLRGFAVFILTDLKETFVMDSDLEFEDMFHYGYLRADESQAYIFIQVNELVNRLLACLKKPVALRIHDKYYEAVRQARVEPIIRDEKELAVIRAIRQGDYKRVTLTKKNDAEMLLELEEDLLDRGLTVKVSSHAEKNTRIKRTLPIPLKGMTSKRIQWKAGRVRQQGDRCGEEIY